MSTSTTNNGQILHLAPNNGLTKEEQTFLNTAALDAKKPERKRVEIEKYAMASITLLQPVADAEKPALLVSFRKLGNDGCMVGETMRQRFQFGGTTPQAVKINVTTVNSLFGSLKEAFMHADDQVGKRLRYALESQVRLADGRIVNNYRLLPESSDVTEGAFAGVLAAIAASTVAE